MRKLAIAIGVMAAALVALVAYARVRGRAAPPLPVLGAMPEVIGLTDQTGAPFTRASLAREAWVADFIFTHCSSSCPRLTARMAELQRRLAEEGKRRGTPMRVRLVSFSVDPEEDTPAVLTGYGKKVAFDPSVWSFVTGDTHAMQTMAVEGFKMATSRVAKGAGEYDVVHGNWFVLGDASAQLRGFYSVGTDEEVALLWRDLVRLEALENETAR